MKTERIGYVLLLLLGVLVISGAVFGAQDASGSSDNLAQATAEMTPESTVEGVFFNDLRVNNQVILGEFGIFCEDAQGLAAGSYAGGAISVYGSNDEQYLSVPEEALTQMSDMATDEPMMAMTDEMGMEVTEEPPTPILLGQSVATQGIVSLYLIGNNEFRLVGFLPDGTQFAYEWVGCTGGLTFELLDGTPETAMTTTPLPTFDATMQARLDFLTATPTPAS